MEFQRKKITGTECLDHRHCLMEDYIEECHDELDRLAAENAALKSVEGRELEVWINHSVMVTDRYTVHTEDSYVWSFYDLSPALDFCDYHRFTVIGYYENGEETTKEALCSNSITQNI